MKFPKREKVSAPAAAPRPKATLPVPAITQPLVLALLLVFAGLYLLLVQVAGVGSATPTDTGADQRQAQVLADRMDGVVLQAQTAVGALVRSPGLGALLAAATPEERVQYGKRFAAAVPGAVSVLLLPAGMEPPADAVGLGFAAREMLSQPQKDKAPLEAPLMEAHQLAGGKRYLNLVDLVPGDPPGRVLLTLDLAELQRVLDGLKEPVGFAEVVQQIGGQEQVLARAGDAAWRRGAPAVTRPLKVAGWKLLFWAPRGSVSEDLSGLTQIALFGALLLLLLVLLVAARRLQQHLDADLDRLMRWLEQLLHGGAADAPRAFHLAGMQELADAWAGGLRRAAEQPPAAAPTVPEPPRPAAPAPVPAVAAVEPVPLDPAIFRAYDIRGVVGENLDRQLVLRIGRAIGSEAAARGETGILIGRDGRQSGVELAEALAEGLLACGLHVVDLGMVPTPALYFATHDLPFRSGVMVTGSHNPPEHNGLKIVLAGETLGGEAIQALRERVETADFVDGSGTREEREILDDYLQALVADVGLARPIKVVVDCGNGAAGLLAPQLLRVLGCEVSELYCEVDGTFPNHNPDTSQPQNLQDLIQVVKGQEAELGIAFDGDGDRLAVVTGSGEIIWPDRLMMIFAMDLLTRHPGADVLFDVKCSRHLGRVISECGGRPVMCKTGHSLMKAKLEETGALLAGEMSGHLFFKERWYGFDDGLYAAARLLEILSLDPRPVAEIFADLPDAMATPELQVPIEEAQKQPFMARLLEGEQWPGGKTNTIDGLRVDFADGWGLVRPSNTTAHLVMRFEADHELALSRIQDQFRARLLAVDPHLELPF